jgi:hypothetical protein
MRLRREKEKRQWTKGDGKKSAGRRLKKDEGKRRAGISDGV